MSSKPEGVFPGFGGAPAGQKTAGFQRLPPMSGIPPGNARSEPLRAPSIQSLFRPAIPVVAVAVIAALPAAIVAIPLKTLHTTLPPAFTAAKPAIHAGQHRKPALLAVIQRLVERIGRIRDFLHGSR